MIKELGKLPSISIIIVTLNNERTIEECVKRIASQDYPKHLIEYLNIDGGSTDKTAEILKKYGFHILISPIARNAEAQREIGIEKAKNNLIVSLDADNFLPHDVWLKQMVQPFMDDKEVIYSGTMHYTYRKNDTLFNKYCALFGIADPTVFYIGKPDRVPQYQRQWNQGNIIKETKSYYIVEFNKQNLPTVGCNGVLYKRDVLLKCARSKPLQFIHIDIFVDLLDKNYKRFAIVKNDVIHDTATSIPMLLKKRISFLHAYYLREKKNNLQRRYFIFNPKKISHIIKLSLFVLYTITFIKPLLDSFRGFVYIRDKAWFMHPFVCWVYLISYSFVIARKAFKESI